MIGGVVLQIDRKVTSGLAKYKALSTRLISVDMYINQCYIFKVYTPTSDQAVQETEPFYEEINESMVRSKAKYIIIMGDFNS